MAGKLRLPCGSVVVNFSAACGGMISGNHDACKAHLVQPALLGRLIANETDAITTLRGRYGN
ncbi:hypothetical protein J6524_34585 [Bradyrhizobium sp. WSM 1738]|uniref:hypothetical protein n=1 Tax=Bradyrhizobium hereditatis TaxID=2821405 RepID=UPI001CE291FD|nr:hypothetical protein [Bradyrhizobium hereditatis]MCA6119960.1 hypothetical protein [Bradyrhizobium hereditatis]